MDTTEARTKILDTIAAVLVDFAMEDDPEADRNELMDLFLDVAADIYDDLGLEVVSTNEGQATLTVKFDG